MSNEFTEVTSESWFARIGNAIKGVLIGGLLFLVSFPLLFWNEGRAVQTAKSLNEGAKSVVEASADNVDAANEGKFVHLTGEAVTNDTLTDSDFGVSVNAIRLTRDVEMYQWVEDVQTEKKKKLGGSEETVKTYHYQKEWSSYLNDSSNFKDQSGHMNPPAFPYESNSWQAKDVSLGAYQLSSDLIRQISGQTSVPVDLATLPESMQGRVAVQSGGFYLPASVPTSETPEPTADEVADNDAATAEDSAEEGQTEVGSTTPAPEIGEPQIGDLRIQFTLTEPGPVSVMAQQSGNSFKPFQTKAGDALLMLEMGTQTAEEMIATAVSRNNMMTWILRGVGALIMFIGMSMILKPLSVLADVVPLLGNIMEVGTGIVAGLITICLAALTISVAWLFYRPLIGVPLLIVSLAAGFYLLKLVFSKKSEVTDVDPSLA